MTVLPPDGLIVPIDLYDTICGRHVEIAICRIAVVWQWWSSIDGSIRIWVMVMSMMVGGVSGGRRV